MKINIIKIIIVITVIIGWMGMAGQAGAVIKKTGNIEIITDEPLFSDSIVWYPGLRVEKSFQVKNRGRGVKTVQIETENKTESRELAKILTVQINEGNRGIYGVSENKTLRNFFDSSEITLGEVFGDDSGKTFSVAVTMPAGAGNEYQGARAKFDLRIGFVGEGSSSVTVAGGGATTAMSTTAETVLGGETGEIEGGEGLEGSEGGRQYPEGGRQSPGEVAGAGTEGINFQFLAIIGGILGIGGLAGWAWWRRSR